MSPHHHHHRHKSSSPSCFFRPSSASDHRPPPPPISGCPNLTTCLYHTDFALFSLTWSRSFLGGRSLHLTLIHHAFESPPPPPPKPSSSLSSAVHVNLKPYIFWNRRGSKNLAANVVIFWDFSRAKFGSSSGGGPEPVSGFYVAVVVDNDMTLLLGDMNKEAYSKTKAHQVLDEMPQPQCHVLKREHVVAKNVYATKAQMGGRIRDIQIDCGGATGDDFSRLTFSIDGEKVLQIKRLKWKFRGNERVEIDGVGLQISWDVYNWLFHSDDGHAVFMFRFEDEDSNDVINGNGSTVGGGQFWNFGMSGIEWRKMMGKSLSGSSVSMSSAVSTCSSSVMEWATMEESELSGGPSGFTLLVYAWRR